MFSKNIIKLSMLSLAAASTVRTINWKEFPYEVNYKGLGIWWPAREPQPEESIDNWEVKSDHVRVKLQSGCITRHDPDMTMNGWVEVPKTHMRKRVPFQNNAQRVRNAIEHKRDLEFKDEDIPAYTRVKSWMWRIKDSEPQDKGFLWAEDLADTSDPATQRVAAEADSQELEQTKPMEGVFMGVIHSRIVSINKEEREIYGRISYIIRFFAGYYEHKTQRIPSRWVVSRQAIPGRIPFDTHVEWTTKDDNGKEITEKGVMVYPMSGAYCVISKNQDGWPYAKDSYHKIPRKAIIKSSLPTYHKQHEDPHTKELKPSIMHAAWQEVRDFGKVELNLVEKPQLHTDIDTLTSVDDGITGYKWIQEVMEDSPNSKPMTPIQKVSEETSRQSSQDSPSEY